MTDETRFEDRLARALREFADQAVVPFDAGDMADRAIGTRAGAARWSPLAVVATIGMAAAVAAIVVASQLITRPVGIGDAQLIGAEELPNIVANASNTPGVWDQTLDQSGEATATTPMRSTVLVRPDGFVDGRTTKMCGTDDAGDGLGCLLAWTALFETVEAAATAYDFYVAEFEAPDGWNVPQGARSDPSGLGDEAVLYTNIRDPATNFTQSGVFLWREENLLMGAVGIGGMEVPALRVIADAMQARAAGDGRSAEETRDAAVHNATGYGGFRELPERHQYGMASM